MVGTVGSGLLTVLIIRILTARLGTGGYGQYVILLSLVSGTIIIVDLGLNGITFRDLAKDPNAAGRIIGTNLGLRCVLCLVAAPLVILLVYLIYPSHRTTLMVPVAIFSFDIVVTVIQTTLLSFYGSKVRSEITAGVLFLGRFLFFGAVYLFGRAHLGLEGVVIAYVSADSVTTIFSVVLVRRAIRLIVRFDPRSWWSTLKRAAPLGALQLINTIYLYVDSILISVLSTNREVAFYGLSFNIITVIGSFSVMFGSSLVPGLAVASPEIVKRAIERALYAILCFCIPLGVGGVVLASNIVFLLGGSHFRPATFPFMLLSISLIATFPGTVLSYTAMSIDKYRRLVGVAGVVLMLNIILNAVFIPISGADGSAVALLISEILSTVVTYLAFARYVSYYPNLLNTWRPALSGIVMLFVGLTLNRAIRGDGFAAMISKAGIIVATYCIVLILCRGIPDELFVLLGRSGKALPTDEAQTAEPPVER
jgi:O-antigen/teichoic acid export membrane protein